MNWERESSMSYSEASDIESIGGYTSENGRDGGSSFSAISEDVENENNCQRLGSISPETKQSVPGCSTPEKLLIQHNRSFLVEDENTITQDSLSSLPSSTIYRRISSSVAGRTSADTLICQSPNDHGETLPLSSSNRLNIDNFYNSNSNSNEYLIPDTEFCFGSNRRKGRDIITSPTGNFRFYRNSPSIGKNRSHESFGSSDVSRRDSGSSSKTWRESLGSASSSGKTHIGSACSSTSSSLKKRKRASTMTASSVSGSKMCKLSCRRQLASIQRSESSIHIFQTDSEDDALSSIFSDRESITCDVENYGSGSDHDESDELNRSRSTGSLKQRPLQDGTERVHNLTIIRSGPYGQHYTSTHAVASLLLENSLRKLFNVRIIDCRYPYEYNGGHVQGAINLPHVEDVLEYLQELYVERHNLKGIIHHELIIFYCEFSSVRGPHTYRQVRGWDRDANNENYPFLYFPEMYIINGGYKKFFENYPELCEPCGYVTMRSQKEQLKYWLQKCNPPKHKVFNRKALKPKRSLNLELKENGRIDRNLASEFTLQL